jgi:MoaA/NifB/PqqE/SkfB family radical SAM enzyme
METVKDCHYPWTWMMVTSDGRARPCCFSTGSLGDLHTQEPEQIWNGKIAIELREYVLQDRIHPICANAACKFVQNMAKPDRAERKT